MKFDKQIEKRLGLVLAFSLVLTGGAVYAGVSSADQAKNVGEKIADANAKGNGQENEGPTAGVSNALSFYDVEALEVTSGVTDLLYDYSVVSLASNQLETVGQGTDKETETNKKEENFCGYKNLGIAAVKEGNLNVRAKASTDSKSVGKMTKHAACEILAQKNGWTKVKSGKVEGYVKSEYLLTGDEALAVAKKEVITVATVNTTTLRVREKASEKSSTLSLVGGGEDLVVEEEKNGWYKVEVDDQKGYISGDYVDISQKLPTAQSVKELQKGEGVSDSRVSLVQYALQFVGNPYVWGGTSLSHGIDCSGFTMQVYAHYGVSLPHHAASQPAYGKRISASQARPGDLFFYSNGGGIGHVGIYIGNGQIVHASNPRSGIKISSAYYRTPVCVTSYLN